MRTTLELPDDLMRHLKARAALEGRSLRDLMLELLNRGLQAPGGVTPSAPLPLVRLGGPLGLPASVLNHADLSALAEE